MARRTASTEVSTEVLPSTTTGVLGDDVSIASFLQDGFSVTRDFKFPEDGKKLHGFFLGAGPPIEMESKKRPGSKDIVATWRLRDPSGSIIHQVMGSKGLDKYVATLAPETEIVIAFLGVKEIGGGQRLNDFAVLVKNART